MVWVIRIDDYMGTTLGFHRCGKNVFGICSFGTCSRLVSADCQELVSDMLNFICDVGFQVKDNTMAGKQVHVCCKTII